MGNHTEINPILSEVVNRFISTPTPLNEEIGEIREVQPQQFFERPFSVQGVYRLKGTQGETAIFVKLFKNTYQKPPEEFDRDVQTEYQTLQFWYEKFRSHPDFSTFRPLYFDASRHCMITQAVQGKNLGEWVEKQAAFFPDRQTMNKLQNWMGQCGRLLKTFQKLAVPNSSYHLSSLIEDVEIRLKELVKRPNSGIRSAFAWSVLQFYRQHLKEAEELSDNIAPVYLHRDFGMNNILIAGKQLILFDFNRMEVGHPYHDFTRLYFQLHLMGYKPIYRPAVLRQLQHAYCQGYGFSGSTNDLLFRFFFLRHVLTHYIGLVRRPEKSFHSHWYNQWVLFQHRRTMKKLIRGIPL